jgi:hypothetical protein
MEVRSQLWANSFGRPYLEKNPSQKWTGGVAQGEGRVQTQVQKGKKF